MQNLQMLYFYGNFAAKNEFMVITKSSYLFYCYFNIIKES